MNGKRKVIIFSVLILMLAAMAGVGGYYWYENTYYVTTEDARVTGDLVRVSPQIAAKLKEFNVEEGQMVHKDQILGQQEATNLPDANLEMANIRAPITGIVLKKQGTVGEVVAPGQMLAMLVDPAKLYISANIDETKVARIKEGQKADIKIDEYGDRNFTGRVVSIGQATTATFSLLPSSTGGNFTKVVQKVPVKIQLEQHDVTLKPGTSAVVKIRVR
ncbi:secretion protein HlyD family protein [Thermincola ferriacetica]|uniref:Secretion protein HlyD family protein n=1 Tax=Thermincola ferriacetica TaxID=281456 RepID=A0A0L6W4I2_9FIRM|nr:HlyD family efflux transporter periplasmic adaptor subunit [Thermincola ferriacetica]KNZ70420.1 secretion protein HlyD family protein [Thermincola ferriacetica]